MAAAGIEPTHVGDACDLDDGEIFIYSYQQTGVHWQAEEGFTRWDLYVGDLDVLRVTGTYSQDPYTIPLALRFCDVFSNWVNPVYPPPAGKATFSLVAGQTVGIDTGLGTNSAGETRANANPCP